MIRFLIYIYAAFLLLKKMFYVILDYKEYYSQQKIKLNLTKAETNTKRNKGLMNRRNKLKDNEGMLFIYKNPQIISMWMKNTYIPLDVLFLDNNFSVIDIKRNMKPLKMKKYSSKKKCKYAIEIKGNGAKTNNIKIGTKIIPNIVKKLN